MINIFKKKNSQKVLRDPESMWHRIFRDPYIDWSIAIVISIVVVVSLVLASYFVFVKSASLDKGSSSAVGASKKTLLDESKLDQVLRDYDARAADRAQLERGYSGVGDPSL
ncbi:MAG: hypothetical protein WCV79_00745 [Candidatus Paceibacterota bacterium]|jgi:hypothetical protein